MRSRASAALSSTTSSAGSSGLAGASGGGAQPAAARSAASANRRSMRAHATRKTPSPPEFPRNHGLGPFVSSSSAAHFRATKGGSYVMPTTFLKQLMLAAAVSASLPLAACSIDVSDDDTRGRKDVDIRTPVGAMTVQTGVNADTGLAVYPGAAPLLH